VAKAAGADDICRWAGGVPAYLLTPRLTLFAAIAEAVGYAHQRGVIHRDLKPGNILVDRDGQPHVLDFGLAKTVIGSGVGGSSTLVSHTGEFMGTLPWASPEQLDGQPDTVEAPSDVYALGVILYQLLTGRLPYPVNGLARALESIRHLDPQRPSTVRRNLDGELDAITLKCLAKEPARRYADAAELAKDIRHYLAGEPIAARRDSVGYRIGKRLRRHRVPAVLIVLLAAVTVMSVLAITATWRSGQRKRLHPSVVGEGLTVVDVAVLGQNVPADIPAASALRVNELRGLPLQADLAGTLDIGHAHGRGEGNLALQPGQRLTLAGGLRVGWDAPGTLHIPGGAQVQSRLSEIGGEHEGMGRVTVEGPGAVWTTVELLRVGSLGHGELVLADGAVAEVRHTQVGYGAPGVLTVRGEGSHFRSGWFYAGNAAVTGKVELLDGGWLTVERLELGYGGGGLGEVLVRGGGSTLEVPPEYLELTVGSVGEGRLQVERGGTVTAKLCVIGREPEAVGQLAMTGPAARLLCGGTVMVGRRGQAAVELADGAGIFCGDGLTIGLGSGPGGTLVVRGRGSVCELDRYLEIGRHGTGIAEVRHGGLLRSRRGTLAGQRGAVGRLLITDAASCWVCRSCLFVGGSFEGAGGAATILLENDGTLAVGDTLRLFGQAHVDLAGGILAVDRFECLPGGIVTLDGGTLRIGTWRGDLSNAGACLATLHPPARLTVWGDCSLGDGVLAVHAFGAPPECHDRLDVEGDVLLGGQLRVSLHDGFEPAYDDRLVVVQATAVLGGFENASPRCALHGGGSCEVIYHNATVVLTHFVGPFDAPPYPPDRVEDLVPTWEPTTAGPFPGVLGRNTTGHSDRLFLGAPDEIGLGLGGQIVEFDFGNRRIVDEPGADFNVYQTRWSGSDFDAVNVLVSADAATFISVPASAEPATRVPGDEACPDLAFVRSYDLATSGLPKVRYVRIDGQGEQPVTAAYGFDLDAVGALHFVTLASHSSAEAD